MHKVESRKRDMRESEREKDVLCICVVVGK